VIVISGRVIFCYQVEMLRAELDQAWEWALGLQRDQAPRLHHPVLEWRLGEPLVQQVAHPPPPQRGWQPAVLLVSAGLLNFC
jgi:hypothetical protein